MADKQVQFKAFLCHASEDKGFVDELYFELTQRGEAIWYDKVKMEPGDSILDMIETGILESQYFCIIVSDTSVGKPWVQRELKAALSLEINKPEQNFKIIPILHNLDVKNMPLWLMDKVYVDFRHSMNSALPSLHRLFSLNNDKIKVGVTTFQDYAAISNFSLEIQSLHKLLDSWSYNIRRIPSHIRDRKSRVAYRKNRLLSLLVGYEWINDIWVQGENRVRHVGTGHVDLLVNPDVAGHPKLDLGSDMRTQGILISAHKKGELFEPANRIIFTIFATIGGKDYVTVARDGSVTQFQYIATGKLVLYSEGVKIHKTPVIAFGDRLTTQIPDAIIREKCRELQVDRETLVGVAIGFAGGVSQLLFRGGIMMYGSFPNSEFDEARFLQGELKPIAHIIHCAMGEAKVPGGGDLIDKKPKSPDERITSFFFPQQDSDELEDIIKLWPPLV